jgi:YD repeat-containing protein
MGVETVHLFVIVPTSRTTVVLPKRVLPDDRSSEVRDRIRANLVDRGGLRHRYPYLVKRTIEGMISATVITLFAGDLHLLADHAYTRIQYVFYSGEQNFAAASDLQGRGDVYLVPIGHENPFLQPSLIDDYQRQFGITLKTLPPLEVPEWTRDPVRHQLVAEELVEAMKYAYPQHAEDRSHILIGITDEDMYISGLGWEFAFNFRAEEQFIVISTAHLADPFGSSDQEKIERRFRKLLTKNLGLFHFGMQFSANPYSVLYSNVGSTADLDLMADRFSRDEAMDVHDSYMHDGDPCITFHRHFSAAPTPADKAFLSGCSSLNRQLNMEVMEVDLKYGLFMDRRTEFNFADRIPLRFTRVLRNLDIPYARAMGMGGNHNLNIFPVGNTWPFTWMDLLLEDGSRIHYKRANWGVAYWDAVYRELDYNANEFAGSTVSWAFPGWEIKTSSGRKYIFPDGNSDGHSTRAEEWGLIEIRDDGGSLALSREPDGNLLRARSPNGTELRFEYDEQDRIRRIEASNGEWASYEYDTNGYLSLASSANHVTEYRREGNFLFIIDNDKEMFRGEFSEMDRVVAFALPNGRAYRFDYKPAKEWPIDIATVTDSDGHVSEYRMRSDGYTVKHLK